MMRAALALTFALAWPVAAPAQTYSSGQDAYAARDWQAAREIWTQEAAAGSAEALLGLGNLLDFGLVGPPDPEAAFERYLDAARLGLNEAAFNVAVMYDSGIIPSDGPQSAVSWYSVAALGGHPRARYNLGQLFADGEGVPQNPDLAAYWLGQAAGAIPAASDALAALETGAADLEGDLSAPTPLRAEIIETASGPEARMSWVAAPGPSDATYRVQMMQMAGNTGGSMSGPMGRAETEGSALAVPLADPGAPLAWRVIRISGDGADYAASDWQAVTGDLPEVPPVGAVRFAFAADDARAEGLALRLGGAMARSGAMVSYDTTAGPSGSSAVRYRFAPDAEFAAAVAEFLPGLGAAGATQSDDADLSPGEIAVMLAFDAAGQGDGG